MFALTSLLLAAASAFSCAHFARALSAACETSCRGVLDRLVQVGLSPIDPLLELRLGLGRGRLHRRLGRRDPLLQIIQPRGEVRVLRHELPPSLFRAR